MKASVLILGASYGSLLATKLLMAGHRVTLVCTRSTAELINREGTVVRFPVTHGEPPLAVASRELPGALHACTPAEADLGAHDLIVLGMQEAQYGSREVRELMARIARSRKPCLAIMNMPPLPFLRRIPGLATGPLEGCYADPGGPDVHAVSWLAALASEHSGRGSSATQPTAAGTILTTERRRMNRNGWTSRRERDPWPG